MSHFQVHDSVALSTFTSRNHHLRGVPNVVPQQGTAGGLPPSPRWNPLVRFLCLWIDLSEQFL